MNVSLTSFATMKTTGGGNDALFISIMNSVYEDAKTAQYKLRLCLGDEHRPNCVIKHGESTTLFSLLCACQSLVKVILGGVSGWRMRVHVVLMSSEDDTLRWKLSRI